MFWQAGIIDSRETLAPGLIEQPAFPIFIQSYNNLYGIGNKSSPVQRTEQWRTQWSSVRTSSKKLLYVAIWSAINHFREYNELYTREHHRDNWSDRCVSFSIREKKEKKIVP